MDDIASKLSLIVCGQCLRKDNESEVDFSTRLFSVYKSCYDNIECIIKQEKQNIVNDSIEKFLSKD